MKSQLERVIILHRIVLLLPVVMFRLSYSSSSSAGWGVM
jgi:hypothetical protein